MGMHQLLLLAACTDDGTPPGTETGVTTEPVPVVDCALGAICPDGEVCDVAGVGMAFFNGLEGPPLEVGLFWPSSASLDPAGCLVVDDYNSNVIRRIDEDGVFRTHVGNGFHAYALDGAWANETPLEGPTDHAYGPDGSMYVYEQHGARILKVDPTGWTTVYAGDPINPGYDRCHPDGVPGREAGMTQGWGLTVGDDGAVYVAEPLTDRIRRVTPEGIVEVLAGPEGEDCDGSLYHLSAGFVDGVGAEARFRNPLGVHYEDGFVYVGDTGNHAIRRIDVATREVVTLAGSGTAGYAGDGGPAADAQLNAPYNLDVDPSGAIFVAEFGSAVVRRIDADGTISTAAGTGVLGAANGPALSAQFAGPQDVHVLPDGDVVVVDMFNARVRIVGGLAAPEP